MKPLKIKRWILITAIICILDGHQVSSLKPKSLLFSDWLNDVDGDNIPGQSGVDYPVYSSVPSGTSFRCQKYDYAGYFADVETDCQAYHVCFPDGRNASFLCVNGTVFHQRYYVCDWWFHSNCSLAEGLYELNLYRKVPLPVLPPVRRREFPGPAPQPRVQQLPPSPRQREPKKVRENQKNERNSNFSDKKEKERIERKRLRENPLSPQQEDWKQGNTKPPFQNRNSGHDDSCNCQCSNSAYQYAASEILYDGTN